MQKQTEPKDRRFLRILIASLVLLLALIVIIALATKPT